MPPLFIRIGHARKDQRVKLCGGYVMEITYTYRGVKYVKK